MRNKRGPCVPIAVPVNIDKSVCGEFPNSDPHVKITCCTPELEAMACKLKFRHV